MSSSIYFISGLRYVQLNLKFEHRMADLVKNNILHKDIVYVSKLVTACPVQYIFTSGLRYVQLNLEFEFRMADLVKNNILHKDIVYVS
jgi:hypothetical protein